jgi:hypothetical protein
MRKCSPLLLTGLLFLVSSTSAFAGITITSPGSGSSVQSPVHFIASSSASSCSKGVAAMGVYDNNVLMATTDGSKMDTHVSLTSGTHSNVVVQYWDFCGNAGKTSMSLKVDAAEDSGDSTSVGKTFANIEEFKGWLAYGELAPVYGICTDCRPEVTWGMKQGVEIAGVSNATRFDVGGEVKYSDALFVNHLIGDGSTQGMPDTNNTVLKSIGHITYTVDFYSDHLELAHALEFDTGLNHSGRAHMFGTECRTEGNKLWAIWDNPGHRWVDTTVPCKALDGKWNHLVLEFTHTSDNKLIYNSITLNGEKSTLNWTNNSIASNWRGLVVNFQLDGNKYQADYSVYLNKLNITYK